MVPQSVEIKLPEIKQETKKIDEKKEEIVKPVDKKEQEKVISKRSGKFSFR